jgi:hypothetical protein
LRGCCAGAAAREDLWLISRRARGRRSRRRASRWATLARAETIGSGKDLRSLPGSRLARRALLRAAVAGDGAPFRARSFHAHRLHHRSS